MNSKSRLMLAVSIAVLLSILMSLTVAANPAAPGNPFVGPVRPNDTQVANPAAGPVGRAAAVKPIDQPNVKDYQRNQERMRLLAEGKDAEAAALDLTADRPRPGDPGRVRRHRHVHVEARRRVGSLRQGGPE